MSTAYSIHRESPAAAREACLAQLEKLGLRAETDSDGLIRGRMWLDIRKLPCIDGIGLAANVQFTCPDHASIEFDDATALCRIEPVPLAGVDTREGLERRIVQRYEKLVDQTQAALRRARKLAPDAHILLSPFRLEGSVEYAGERLLLLFASRGHRACILGIDDRPVSFLPSEPRIVFDAAEGPPSFPHARWDAGVEQARACLGEAAVPTEEEVQRSVDLVSRDLSGLAFDDGHAIAIEAPVEIAFHAAVDAPVTGHVSLDLIESLDLSSGDLPD